MKFSPTKCLAAILNSGGIKKNICEKLGCSRPTLDAWMEQYPAIASAYHDEREKLKDLSEERLIEQIQMGNLGAIIWYQKTQCKDRGYVERQEVTGKDGGPVETVELTPQERADRVSKLLVTGESRASANGAH